MQGNAAWTTDWEEAYAHDREGKSLVGPVILFILSALMVAADIFALCALSARPWERHQVLTLCLSIVAFTISGTYRWITICTTLDQRKQNRKRQKERRTGL